MKRNNGCRLRVVGYAMMKKDLSKKQMAAKIADESASTSAKDRLRVGRVREKIILCIHIRHDG